MATPRRDEKKSRERQARAARLATQRRQRMIKTFTTLGVFAVVLVLVGSSFSVFGNKDDSDKATGTTTTALESTAAVRNAQPIKGDTPCPAADGSSAPAGEFEKAPPMCIDPTKKYSATFDTTEGKIVVALDTTRTPATANNFAVLARYHYYDGTRIFRSDPSIDILQGGSPHTESASDQGPGYNIQDEGGKFTYTEGDLVMARGAGANSASAQFFFATGPKVSNLDTQGTYVTFGKATEGLDVLKKIIGLHTATSDGLGGKPSRPVTINKLTITES